MTAADLLMAAGMHGRQASFLALAVLAMALPAQAAEALHFTARTVHVHPADDDNEIRVSFPFSCVAAVPVTILSSRTSCGCTLATLSELVNAPGQQGSVDAVVDVGNVSGAVTRTITLITNHHDDRTIVLTIAADLPPVPSFTPSFLSWQLGAEPATKSIAILLPLGCTQRLTGASCEDPHWTVAFTPGADERAASLAVTPSSTMAMSGTAITIRTRSHRCYTVKAVIAPPPSGAGATPPPEPPAPGP